MFNNMYFNKGNLLFLFLIFILVFIPLYPKFPLLSVFGTYVAIRLEDIFIALLVGFWFVSNFKRIKALIYQPITQSFLLFWFIGALTILSGIFITFTVDPHLGLLHFIRRIEYMSLFFVAATTIKNIKQAKVILLVMLFTTILVITYGFGQIYLGFPVVSTTNREFSKGQILFLTPDARVSSTFAGHYDLAIYLSYVLTFLGAFLIYERRILDKIIIIASGMMGSILLAMTASRISFAATFFALVSVFWLLKKRLLIGVLTILTIVVLLVTPQLRERLIATINVNVLKQGSELYVPATPKKEDISLEDDLHSLKYNLPFATEKAKIKDASRSGNIPVDIAPGEPTNYTELEVSRSLDIRTQVEWPRAIASFTRNPFLGTGYSSITIATDNDFLRSLGETGLLGFLSLILIFAIISKRFLQSLSKVDEFSKTYLIGCIGILVVAGITAIFFDILEASKVATLFWIFLGIGWALTEREKL